MSGGLWFLKFSLLAVLLSLVIGIYYKRDKKEQDAYFE
jgi:hypothetical protein